MSDGNHRELALRHPLEADQPRLVRLVEEWFGGRRVRHLLVRAWFRHVGSTSRLAEDATGQPIGFVIGYRSQDHPDEGVVHLVAVHPNHRRLGIGRTLIESCLTGMAASGVTTVTATAWPDDPVAVTFFRAMGFEPDDGPGSQNLYGTTAYPDYEAHGEDRIVFVRRTSPGIKATP